MMYSCALWSEAENGVRGDLDIGPVKGDLEMAQLRKIHHVLRAARVKPGHRILEFGSGWGGLAIEVRAVVTRVSGICQNSFTRRPVLSAARSTPSRSQSSKRSWLKNGLERLV